MMSKPQFKVGDRVRLRRDAVSFGAGEEGDVATITDDGWDPGCWKEGCTCVCWATLIADDGYPFYHVNECDLELVDG